MSDIDRASDALQAVSNNDPDWVSLSMSAKVAGVPFEVWHDWTKSAEGYKGEADARARWKSFAVDGKGVGAGTLFKRATENGWRDGDKPLIRSPAKPQARTTAPKQKPRPGMTPADVYERSEPATHAHGYIVAKGAAGVPLEQLRVVPAGDKLMIAGKSMAGALVVPAYGPDGLQSLQLIPPPGTGKKLNLPGSPMSGAWFTVGELAPDAPVYVCEGIGQAWACWQARGHAAVVAFGWGNVSKVAAALRQQYPSARLVLVPDAGKDKQAHAIAKDLQCAVAYMPPDEPDNFDASDLAQRDGPDVLAALLEGAREPEPPPLPLTVTFADELSDTFSPPDELVQGVLTAEDASVIYGDSNSGKTFLAIDLSCAMARGVPWMDRQTEPGLVIYLAAESPASVKRRLQAYQKYHGAKVPNFAIVQNPIDLFANDADTDKVIHVIRSLEKQRGQKVRLIVGDTLARLSAGANENAGQDMGLVVSRIDRIRNECKVHFLLIHHSGKNAAAGQRGWSGIRAAIDTEIEVTDSPAGRCAEIMKQRELGSKGERVGFRLDPVVLGVTKWGDPATSCIVLPTDAPDKPQGKRLGEVEGAVVEFLATHKVGIKKALVVKHFEDRYEKGPVYRAMKALVTAEVLIEAAGMVAISGAAK